MLYKPLDLPYIHTVYDGVPVQTFVTHERMDEIRNKHQSRPDDIYIATFLKSGTTWLQYLVYEMLDRPQGEYENINLAVPWLEDSSQLSIDDMVSPRIIKTHARWEWTPKGEGVKYIYCYRNPKDVVVSYYYHQKNFDQSYSNDCTLNEFVSDVFLKYNCTEYGYYFDQVSEWLRLQGNTNILYVTFEDMVEDLRREIKRIASFLNVNVSDEKVEQLYDNGAFTSMKENRKLNYSWREGTSITGKSNFLRKGKVGDWINYLTEEHSREIELLVDKYLIPLGAKIRYTLD